MAEGRLYQAFMNAGFEEEMKAHQTYLENGTMLTLAHHVMIFDNMAIDQTNTQKAQVQLSERLIGQVICIKVNENPYLIPQDPKQSDITLFINKYAPKTQKTN